MTSAQPIDPPGFSIQPAVLGGSGPITGLVQHPRDARILYARSDVAGVFKTTDHGESWRAVNNGMHHGHDHSVRSLAISLHQPGQVFRCAGEARGGKLFGTIHKSNDGGASWYAVCQDVDFYGKGPTNTFAEVIAVDPFDADCVAAGGYSAGVWISTDQGDRWFYSGLKGKRITGVFFHPAVARTIYVGTAGDAVLERPGVGLESQFARYHDFERGAGRVYRTTDRGRTWELLCSGYDVVELVFDAQRPATLYMATVQHGILRSGDGGHTWVPRTQGLPPDVAYQTLTTAPGENTLYTAPDRRGHPDHIAPIPVFRSGDGGENWELLKWHVDADLHRYPAHVDVERAGWSIASVRVDHADPRRLYLCNGYGVAISPDGGQSWACHNAGLETACVETIVVDPGQRQRVFVALSGQVPRVSTDGGGTFTPLPAPPTDQGSSTALVASRRRPGLVIYGLTNEDPLSERRCVIVRAEDGGQSPEIVFESAPGLFLQAIVEDPHRRGRFYAYIEGAIAAGAGLYRSTDWGRTWDNLDIRLPGHITTLPHQPRWIEAELLSAVVHQPKNGCGTNQLLALDPYHPDTFYLGEWTEGLFRITEDGKQVAHIDHDLPFGRDRASVLTCVRADPRRPGCLYAGFVREGLWRSSDFGRSWRKLHPRSGTDFNASALAIGGPAGKQIAVACEPLYWSPAESGIWFSPDAGATWVDLTDPELGAIRWKGIAIDERTGAIHACACGNGCFTFQPNGASAARP